MKPLALSWAAQDPENRVGIFRAGSFTAPNGSYTLFLALIASGLFFVFEIVAMQPAAKQWPALSMLVDPVLRPGNLPISIPVTLLFYWCMFILFVKGRKLKFQEKALALSTVPQRADFVLNEESAAVVLQRINVLVDSPRHFILLNRLERALANLKNVGGVSDVSSILKAQAENDESFIYSSYLKIQGFVWAIPVLGFIGTVMGLSQAIGQFAGTLKADAADVTAIKANLTNVTGGLSVAFETTLYALVASLIIQLYSTRMQEKENTFLDACSDYCHSHVLSRLKVAQPQADAQFYAIPQQVQPQAGVAPSG